jgi:hypothetical protein
MAYLGRVVECGLLGDDDLGHDEAGVECPVGEVLEDVALARAEAAADQHAAGWGVADALGHLPEQLGEAVFHPDLGRPERGHGVPVGHAGAQRLQGSPALDGVGAHAAPSRTSEEYGLSRKRSRTSS